MHLATKPKKHAPVTQELSSMYYRGRPHELWIPHHTIDIDLDLMTIPLNAHRPSWSLQMSVIE